jgi:hypothetical protein
VLKNAVSGIGLTPDTAMVVFPIEVFMPGSDISSFETRKREFYDGLMQWKSTVAPKATGAAPMLKIEGATYEDALFKANDYLIAHRQGDGLPLWPATRERVDWILRGTPLPRTHLLGKFPPRGGITTVETCAISLAMAGGRPEYLPVLIAVVEACFEPKSEFELLQATSGGPYAVVVVNGPIGKQIRLNSGFGCLGPDPQHPAGASIGRALRLLQQNVGGALPGIGTMGSFGGMRYTNAVFAEDEEGLPADWPTHAMERHGFAREQNSISLAFASSATNIPRRGAKKETPEDEVLQGMYRVADYLRTPNMGALKGYEDGMPGLLMVTRVVAQRMAKLGWTKTSMREFLWEHSKIPAANLRRNGLLAWLEIDPSAVVRASIPLEQWPITAKPENISIVIAGGGHPTHSYWLQGHTTKVVGQAIRLPETFDELLTAADRDLGGGDTSRI